MEDCISMGAEIEEENRGFHYTQCRNRKLGLNGDADNSFGCLLTGRADADDRGWGYDPCDFAGDDYRQCPRMNDSMKMLERMTDNPLFP